MMGGARWAAQYWRVIGPSPSHRPAQHSEECHQRLWSGRQFSRWQFAHLWHLEQFFCSIFGNNKLFRGHHLWMGDHRSLRTLLPPAESPVSSIHHLPWPSAVSSQVITSPTTERCYLPSKETNIHYIQILKSTLPLHCSGQLAVIAGRTALFLSVCSDEH